MNYLLDINALLAWEHTNSPHHANFHAWSKRAGASNLWTCAHAELGFLRVSTQVFSYSLLQASDALASMKGSMGGFLATAPSPRLPSWAANPAKTSDGYLTQLARENNMKLGTFDAGINDPVAELIRGK